MREENRLALLFLVAMAALVLGNCCVRTELELRRTLVAIEGRFGPGVALEIAERSMYEADQHLAIRIRSAALLIAPPGLAPADEFDIEYLREEAQAAGVIVGPESKVFRGEIGMPDGGFCHPWPCNAAFVTSRDGRVGCLFLSEI